MAEPLAARFLQDAHYVHRTLFATVPIGTSVEDVMSPAFWSYVAPMIRVHDKIEVISEDGSLDLELRAIEVGRLMVRVRMIRAPIGDVVAAPMEMIDPDKLPAVGWGGPKHKWRVYDVHGEVLAHGFATREDAQVKLEEYRASMRIAA